MRSVPFLAVAASAALLWTRDAIAETEPDAPFSDQLLRDAAFDRATLPAARAESADGLQYAPGEGLTRWRTDQLQLSPTERLTISRGGADTGPAGQPLGPPRPWDAGDLDRFGVDYQRDWPGAVRGKAGRFAFEVTPRAGLGVSDTGGSAGAGATIRFGQDVEDEVADRLTDALGLNTVDGASFKGRGRWYVFAAADGRAVGLNVLRDRDGDWSRRGWSSDAASSLVSEAQVGVGWRKGAMQASFGYLHREIKVDGIHNAETTKMDDGAIAFSLSIKPEG
jgi:hypothetical protein